MLTKVEIKTLQPSRTKGYLRFTDFNDDRVDKKNIRTCIRTSLIFEDVSASTVDMSI